jgi:LysM repeat protein
LYQVRTNDTLDTISKQFGVPVSSLAQWNNISDVNQIGLGQKICLVSPSTISALSNSTCKTTYAVRSGDTIDTIAKIFDVDPTMLANVNNIADINVISLGQLLCIPTTSNALNFLL